MQYKRLIDKVRRYDKYKEAYAIDCTNDTMQLAMYSGSRNVGDMVFVVSNSSQTQVVITQRKGDLIRYRVADTDDRELDRLKNLAGSEQEEGRQGPNDPKGSREPEEERRGSLLEN